MALISTVGASKVVFSDVNPDVNVETAYELSLNEDAINKSIVTILNTRRGSRVFNRNFGSYLESYLFEPLDATTAFSIKMEILDSIKLWEPRLLIKNVVVLPDFILQAYYVSIDYTIPALLNKSATFNFNLSSGN